VWFYLNLMREMREAIANETFSAWADDFLSNYK
jgi:queuine/archaeosine tRNA-ribosyltransferase